MRPRPSPWLYDAPTVPGSYMFRCEENDQKPERIEVFWNAEGWLICECHETGQHTVDYYHHNLTKPSWQWIASRP